MTDGLDLDALTRAASAAKPRDGGPWYRPTKAGLAAPFSDSVPRVEAREFIATFTPEVVLRLIQRVREAESEHTPWCDMQGHGPMCGPCGHHCRGCVYQAERADAAERKLP